MSRKDPIVRVLEYFEVTPLPVAEQGLVLVKALMRRRLGGAPHPQISDPTARPPRKVRVANGDHA